MEDNSISVLKLETLKALDVGHNSGSIYDNNSRSQVSPEGCSN